MTAGQKQALPEIACAVCGREFVPKRKTQKVCGDECRITRARILAGCPAKQSVKNCAICGSEFMPVRKNQKCCCDSCRYALQKEQHKAWIWKNNHNPQKTRQRKIKALRTRIAKLTDELNELLREESENGRGQREEQAEKEHIRGLCGL